MGRNNIAAVETSGQHGGKTGRPKPETNKLSLPVAIEEIAAEVLEDAIAEQAIISCGVAAPGYRSDDVDLVKHPPRGSIDAYRGVAQRLQHAIAESCSTSATT